MPDLATGKQVLTFANEPGRLELLGVLTFADAFMSSLNRRPARSVFEQEMVMADVIFRHAPRGKNVLRHGHVTSWWMW